MSKCFSFGLLHVYRDPTKTEVVFGLASLKTYYLPEDGFSISLGTEKINHQFGLIENIFFSSLVWFGRSRGWGVDFPKKNMFLEHNGSTKEIFNWK